MPTHWFPGHMNKAKREIGRSMAEVDVIIEVLDARIPESSSNPEVERLRAGRPCIKVLSKSDLADPDTTAAWVAALAREEGVTAMAIDREQRDVPRRLIALGRRSLADDRNADRPMRVMVCGIPNVGKSTLINALAGRSLAKTGDVPAVTRRQQKIAIAGNAELLDTPGILWPRLRPPERGYRLAMTGAIPDTQFDYEELALYAAGLLLRVCPDKLVARYKLKATPEDASEALQVIAARRGCLARGGVVNMQKVSELIVHEYRRGLLPQVSLEHPDDPPLGH